MIACCFFERSCFLITFYDGFMLGFLMLVWLCPFFKNQIVFFFWYGFVLRLFCVLLFLF